MDFLKTSEGVKLGINKLLDMAAQVRGEKEKRRWKWENPAGLEMFINNCSLIITDR